MKKVFLLVIILFTCGGCHRRPLPPMKFEWSEVVNVPGVSKDKLYQRALEWYNENFNNMKAVIQSQDKETGTFYAKGYLEYHGRVKGTHDIYFTIDISVKEGKYKYTFNNFKDEAVVSISHHKDTKLSLGLLDNGLPQKPHPGVKKKYWMLIRNDIHEIGAPLLVIKLKEKMLKKSLPESY